MDSLPTTCQKCELCFVFLETQNSLSLGRFNNIEVSLFHSVTPVTLVEYCLKIWYLVSWVFYAYSFRFSLHRWCTFTQYRAYQGNSNRRSYTFTFALRFSNRSSASSSAVPPSSFSPSLPKEIAKNTKWLAYIFSPNRYTATSFPWLA